MISFPCGGCGVILKVGDDRAGRQGKCPKCGGAIAVPTAPVVAAVNMGGLSAAERVGQPPPAGSSPANRADCGSIGAAPAASAPPIVPAPAMRTQYQEAAVVTPPPLPGSSAVNWRLRASPAAHVPEPAKLPAWAVSLEPRIDRFLPLAFMLMLAVAMAFPWMREGHSSLLADAAGVSYFTEVTAQDNGHSSWNVILTGLYCCETKHTAESASYSRDEFSRTFRAVPLLRAYMVSCYLAFLGAIFFALPAFYGVPRVTHLFMVAAPLLVIALMGLAKWVEDHFEPRSAAILLFGSLGNLRAWIALGLVVVAQGTILAWARPEGGRARKLHLGSAAVVLALALLSVGRLLLDAASGRYRGMPFDASGYLLMDVLWSLAVAGACLVSIILVKPCSRRAGRLGVTLGLLGGAWLWSVMAYLGYTSPLLGEPEASEALSGLTALSCVMAGAWSASRLLLNRQPPTAASTM